MRAGVVEHTEITLRQKYLLLGYAGLGKELSHRARDKTLPPKIEPHPTRRSLVADAVDRGNVTPVGHRMRALDRLPRGMLPELEFPGLARMPANGRGIDQNLRPLQRRESRSLRVPLIPADQHP